jgi:hypothetical protein
MIMNSQILGRNNISRDALYNPYEYYRGVMTPPWGNQTSRDTTYDDAKEQKVESWIKIFLSNEMFINNGDSIISLEKNSVQRTDIQSEINQRLKYLDDIFDEEENMERYRHTKVLLEQFFNSVLLKEPPLIGIDNNGKIMAEWHDINDCKIISIKPETEKRITVFCLKVTGIIFTVITRLEDLTDRRDKDLQAMLSGILT